MRAGIGFDAHRLVQGRPLILGGVQIPFDKGLEGHSDADVLTHAVVDALLGAAGLGDIGAVFPSSDPAWKGASSLQMLRTAAGMLAGEYRTVLSVDAVVMAEAPTLAAHRSSMAEGLAVALGVPVEVVSVKATTTDGLGFTGRGEGIAAQAVALVS